MLLAMPLRLALASSPYCCSTCPRGKGGVCRSSPRKRTTSLSLIQHVILFGRGLMSSVFLPFVQYSLEGVRSYL